MHAHASLNRIYRLVWSALHQTWVVASEITRGRGKSSATPLLSAALLAGLASGSGGLWAAPEGGQVVSGSGSNEASLSGAGLGLNWQGTGGVSGRIFIASSLGELPSQLAGSESTHTHAWWELSWAF